ncbi:MAG: glycoside hydrolase family 92 protein, partial [Bacteroidales bacterium]|nr:glycoside hydrolase family 92 protein [Bacteroidales bacterium]
AFAQDYLVWSIGEKDNSSAELTLGPDGYKEFLANDLGYEDGYFIVGKSDPKKDFSYVLPGPDDTWGGTWSTSGWRTHQTNILFTGEGIGPETSFRLVVDMLDCNPGRSLLKVSVNGKVARKFSLKGKSNDSIIGKTKGLTSRELTVDIPAEVIRNGGNEVTLSILEGSWFIFDDVRLYASAPASTKAHENIFLRDVSAAGYQISESGRRFQPLLVDLESFDGIHRLDVMLDGKKIFSENIEGKHRYCFEAPMPVVKSSRTSSYEVRLDGSCVEKGKIVRGPKADIEPCDYVDTKIGSAHSRWMIAPGPWMPMGMVKISPDNQNKGWQAGYQPTFETVGCFSHIHEWTMGGLGIMPTNGKLQTFVGDQFDPDSGYRSRIDKFSEEAPLGYYKVKLTDTDILAEVSATTRCSFHRYTFPQDKDGRIMMDLHIQAEYDYKLVDVCMKQVSPYRIEGYSHQLSPRPNVWSNDADQEYTVNFVIEFDQPVKKTGIWKDDSQYDSAALEGRDLKEAGMWVEFDTKASPVVQSRIGISLVSVENAGLNLQEEIAGPCGWSFDAVVEKQKEAWADIMSRTLVETPDRLEKVRFYSNVYRTLCRNTWSDVNGDWVAPDETVHHLDDPDARALGCDAFWNTFWNLNQYWNLATPEWSSRWVKSQLGLYDACGWLGKGPAGMEYIPVMVAEHEIPQIVSAYQMGIRDFDAKKALEACVKMQTTPASPVAGGFAGNRDLVYYLTYHYVPYDLGRFSNTLEYSYDDYTVGQFAKALGDRDMEKVFSERGGWWRNAINTETGYAHLKGSDGKFTEDFNPFLSGANEEYVEGNSWQLSYFVPQDIPALAEIMGEKAFVERLNWGFERSELFRYNAPNDQYWDYPVVQGNQQSMQFAFLFNWVNHPWLTQKWSRSIMDRYYGYGLANAYLGDEDQGQMSAWFVMAALGLFQMDGGCSTEPVYEIASPLFRKTTIDLRGMYGRGDKFVIEAKNVSRYNMYVQSATLNGKPLTSFRFPASELLKGGSLILEMGPEPNTAWGLDPEFTNLRK